MNNIMNEEQLARMLQISRVNAEKSQEYMSLELEVSRKLVRKWENGEAIPNAFQLIKWFKALGSNPTIYLYKFLYPQLFHETNKEINEKDLNESLANTVSSLPVITQLQLMFILSGIHGSSPIAVIHEMTANLQTPMIDRYSVGRMVEGNYLLAKEMNTIMCPENVQPDMEYLHGCILKGKKAILNNENTYVG